MTNADRHAINPAGAPKDTMPWLKKYGYRGLVSMGAPGCRGGLLFCRPGESPQMAMTGDVLRWDGKQKMIVVEYGSED